MTTVGGPPSDTLAGDIVTIIIPSDGYYCARFIPDKDGCAAVLDSFTRKNGIVGPLEKHRGVHKGDVLLEVNETSTMMLSHADTIKLIEDKNTLRRVLKFINSREYYRRKKVGNTITSITEVKNTFYSNVKQFRYQGKGSKKIVEYEISCQYRMVSEKVNKEIVYKWSVWKRYSHFFELHNQLLRALGWQMDGIVFPSGYVFVFNKLSPAFVEQRRQELVEYWQKITSIDKITEFQKHHCSDELKQFLELNKNMSMQVAPAIGMAAEDLTSPSKNNTIDSSSERDNKISPVVTGSSRGPLMSLNNRSSQRLSGKFPAVNAKTGETTPSVSSPPPPAPIEEKQPAPIQDEQILPPDVPEENLLDESSEPPNSELSQEGYESSEVSVPAYARHYLSAPETPILSSVPSTQQNKGNDATIYAETIPVRTMAEREDFLATIKSFRRNQSVDD